MPGKFKALAVHALAVGVLAKWSARVVPSMEEQRLHELFSVPVLVYGACVKQLFDVLVEGHIQFIVFVELRSGVGVHSPAMPGMDMMNTSDLSHFSGGRGSVNFFRSNTLIAMMAIERMTTTPTTASKVDMVG